MNRTNHVREAWQQAERNEKRSERRKHCAR